MASSSGSGCSLLKARNTAYIKNSLGSIFIRISHLFRFIWEGKVISQCSRHGLFAPLSTLARGYPALRDWCAQSKTPKVGIADANGGNVAGRRYRQDTCQSRRGGQGGAACQGWYGLPRLR